VFSTRSVRKLRDATIDELLGEALSVPSLPRCYKQDKSRVWSVVRESPVSKGVNTEAEGSTALEAVTRQGMVKPQQTEKT
jgi:hypothetical protein